MDVTPIEKQGRKLSAETTRNKNAATRLHAQIVRARGKCQFSEFAAATGLETVPCEGALQCCHLIRRKRSAVRTDLRNAASCCRGHHFYIDTHHKVLIEFCDWLYGDGWYDHLQAKADGGIRATGLSPLMFWRHQREQLRLLWEVCK